MRKFSNMEIYLFLIAIGILAGIFSGFIGIDG
jgi:uncharacterized membrane protein YfcA